MAKAVTLKEMIKILDKVIDYVEDNDLDLCEDGEDLVNQMRQICNRNKKVDGATLIIRLADFYLPLGHDEYDSNIYKINVMVDGKDVKVMGVNIE